MQTKIFNNILDTIGNTPIIRLDHQMIPSGKKLFLKLEQFNPNFSIKDRTALGLIKAAFDRGILKPGSTVIESSSGNLGKSLAMLGAVLNFKVIIVVDPKVSKDSLNWLKAYGAEIDLVTKPDETGGYQKARIERVKALLKQHKNSYWPNQYDNPDNPAFHQSSTAEEIQDLNVDIIVGSISTGGHLCGIARGLKKINPDIKVLACDVKGSAVFSNFFKPYLLNGVGLGWRAKNTDLSLFDLMYSFTDQEAISMCRIIAKDSGLLIGGSGGLVLCGAISCLNINNIKSVLAIVPDTGVNYLDSLYDDEWLNKKCIILLNSILLNNRLVLHANTLT